MRSEARLDSAVFQLTPTRTRCDLVIIHNGKADKIASGLLNPFVSHLKTAQDQIAKGGYSIKLEPDPNNEAAWFTKGTVERFVRFVSTPEVLERVNTIESEILQIEEAISSQGNDNLGLSTEAEQLKSFGSTEGEKQMLGADIEKAIVLHKIGSQSNSSESNESKMNAETSKVQLVRVLESRKKVLQKEQAMAFARAAAAGFEMESMSHLTSFAEFFGASRLREACTRYTQLWKSKHESGQWIEVEAAEALSFRSEFPPLNRSEILFSEEAMKQKEFIEAWPVVGGDVGRENTGNAPTQANDQDRRLSSEPQVTHGQPIYQGHPPFPQWPIQSQPSSYLFQPFPMQAMPFYQNYPVDNQVHHSPYPSMEDHKLNTHQRKGKKKHSKYAKDDSSLSDDGAIQNTSEYEEEPSRVRRPHRRAGLSQKKKGVVVIRNLNYIAGKRRESLGKSESSSEIETDGINGMLSDLRGREHMPSGSSKRKENHREAIEKSKENGRDEERYEQEEDDGKWQAFQSFLMEAEEEMTSIVDGDILAGEKDLPVKKGQNEGDLDPILLSSRDSGNYQEENNLKYDAFSGKGSRPKQTVFTDEFVSSEDRFRSNRQEDEHFEEIDGASGYLKAISDDFVIYERDKQMPVKNTSDLMVDFEHVSGDKFGMSSPPAIIDESFVVTFRSESQYQLGEDRRRSAINMDSEFQSSSLKDEESSKKATAKVNYEPDDLTLILERTRESELAVYNQTTDFDIQAPLIVKQEREKEEDDALVGTNEGSIKTDEAKLKSPKSELEKKRKDTNEKKMASLRPTPMSEAQKRAESLRNYKTDLQKMKKEHEKEDRRRLEALKRERQKRIVARNDTKTARSPVKQRQSNHTLPEKVLPLRKLPRPALSGFNVSNKGNKTAISKTLSNPASSLSLELKKTEKQDRNSVSERIRRLSEPKGGIVHSVPAKSANTNQMIKKAQSEASGSKKISTVIQLEKTDSKTFPENNQKLSHIHENPVMEKTERMLEREAQIEGNQVDLINSFEVVDYADVTAINLSSTEKPRQNPNIGASFFECSTDQVKATNFLYPETTMINTDAALKVSDLRPLYQMNETREKPQNQESKGRRKLWKFGRKSHNSHSDESTVDDDTMTPNEISRPFSILSPFRGRSSEKNVAA